jgi:hypothetical protein
MIKIFRWFYESIADSLTVPVRLIRTLAENPDIRILIAEPTKTVDAYSVVQWRNWFNLSSHARSKTSLQGWHNDGGYGYSGTAIEVPELIELVKCDVIEHWGCDIREVEGLSASKSPIEKFESMDSFAERHCDYFIDEISEEKLHKNLAHAEIRIIHNKDTCDHFACYSWDGRTLLMNTGGSHHFAAARYIAGKINQEVNLQGKLYRYSLNPVSIEKLCNKFDIFTLKSGSPYGELFESLKHFQASFFTLDLPKPYDGVAAIFLPRIERRSMRVAGALRNAKFFDLGLHLTELAGRQALMLSERT